MLCSRAIEIAHCWELVKGTWGFHTWHISHQIKGEQSSVCVEDKCCIKLNMKSQLLCLSCFSASVKECLISPRKIRRGTQKAGHVKALFFNNIQNCIMIWFNLSFLCESSQQIKELLNWYWVKWGHSCIALWK